MSSYLLFHLYAPLMAWGEAATGEARASANRPSKSALLGLLAAASGISRCEEDRHRQLEEGLGFAVRVDHPGRQLIDYHTVQAPKPNKHGFRSRGDELQRGDLATILSERGYLQDACFTVAFWARTDQVDLGELDRALQKPCWVPFLGRKSCPPAWPLIPQLIEADSLAAAFQAVPLPELLAQNLAKVPYPSRRPNTDYYWEGDASGFEVRYQTTRPDRPISRIRRTFAARAENHGTVTATEA